MPRVARPNSTTEPIKVGRRPNRSPNTPAKAVPTAMPTRPRATMGAKSARVTPHSLMIAGIAKPSTWLSNPSRTMVDATSAITSFWYPVQRPSSIRVPTSTTA